MDNMQILNPANTGITLYEAKKICEDMLQCDLNDETKEAWKNALKSINKAIEELEGEQDECV